MQVLNVEIKARHKAIDQLRTLIEQHPKVRYVGLDHQIDTYYKVPKGRMKLRRGTIENHLIHYLRNNQKGPKASEVLLYKPAIELSLKQVLDAALEVLVVVDKKRSIYFIENVKFHLDEVKGLGSFVEIEAIDKDGSIGEQELQKQCAQYIRYLGIDSSCLVADSYSDLLSLKK